MERLLLPTAAPGLGLRGMGQLLPAAAPDLGRGVTPLVATPDLGYECIVSNKTDFCMLILHPATLLNLLMNSSSLLVAYLLLNFDSLVSWSYYIG